jgi:hypothetical protein
VPLELFVKKFVTVFVSMVDVLVYLLAVVDSKEVPAASVSADPVASSKLAHRCGFVPCAESDMVKVLELRFAGALGVDFITNVTVASSSWANVSGVPDALNLKLMLPADVPE